MAGKWWKEPMLKSSTPAFLWEVSLFGPRIKIRIWLAFVPGFWETTYTSLEVLEWQEYLWYSWALWIIPEFMVMRWLRTGAGHQRDQLWAKGLGLWIMRGQPNRLTSREQRGVEDCIQSQAQWLNQSRLCNETPIKTLVSAAQRCFLGTNASVRWEGDVSWSHREREQKLSSGDCLRPQPQSLSIWLVLIRILYNKTVMISIVLSWVLSHARGLNLRGRGKPCICSWLVRSAGGLGPPKLMAGVHSASTGQRSRPWVVHVKTALQQIIFKRHCRSGSK